MTHLAAPRAEMEVLAAMLIGRDIRDAALVEHRLTTGHFADPARQAMFDAIVAAHDRHQADRLTAAAISQPVRDDVRTTPETAQQALAVLDDTMPMVIDLGEHLRELHDLEQRRRWEKASGVALRAARHGDTEAMQEAVELLSSTPGSSRDRANPDRLADEVAAYLQSDGDVGYTTGLPALDRATGGGLRPGDTTALAAWTGIGKSCLVDTVLEVNSRRGRRVHAYVNEMSFVDRGLRMVARGSDVPFQNLAARNLNDLQMRSVLKALSDLPFGVTDTSSWSVQQVCRDIRARRWDMACLDVLHNIPYRDVQELDRIIANLAASARTVGTHLILVCHLNRERARDARLPPPTLRDIRGSGMLANVCASVLFVHREQTVDGDLVHLENEGTCWDAKHRHGPGGGSAVRFNPKRMRFEERVPTVREAA